LCSVGDPVARATLIAGPDPGASARYRFDIVLRGDGETAFFTD